jgi:hypothetical protein
LASTETDNDSRGLGGLLDELDKLRAFYKAVAHLTTNHDHIEISDDEGYAVVFPSKLGPELEKIDKEWWKNA